MSISKYQIDEAELGARTSELQPVRFRKSKTVQPGTVRNEGEKQ